MKKKLEAKNHEKISSYKQLGLKKLEKINFIILQKHRIFLSAKRSPDARKTTGKS